MDDLFDQVKKELEANGEIENNDSGQEASTKDLVDDISWDDVAGELEEQRQMIKDEAAVKGAPPAAAPSAPGSDLADEDDDGLLSALNSEQRQQLPPNIGFILDIPLQLSVEIGRARMLINDLLQLGQGSVVELEKLAGEPFDVLVNNKLIARGEVVVVNEKFGIRLTDIISPTERIEQLK